MTAREGSLDVEGRSVSTIYQRPDDARFVLALAHGAGAGMRHAFMADLAAALGRVGVATLRYEFPYMEQRGRRPDPPARLEATVIAAVARAAELAPDLPLFAGGKSMGGRMTSQAASKGALSIARGLVFWGFPLHPANAPSTKRADHLAAVAAPMLFLQGTRDALADLSLLRPIVASLGARATMHVVEGADHGFSVLVRSGRTHADVLDELATTAVAWMSRVSRVIDAKSGPDASTSTADTDEARPRERS